MSTYHAIVWIDRSEAHVIMFDRDHVEAQKIKSRSHHKSTGGHVGSHRDMHGRGDKTSGGHSPKGGHSTSDDNFYHEVARALEGVHEVLLTGPAQGKDEFRAHCQHHDKEIDKAIVGVVTTDHPTDPQLVAMARQYFIKHDKMDGQGGPVTG
jgi:stalled ribosome rescue protein Dom34